MNYKNLFFVVVICASAFLNRLEAQVILDIENISIPDSISYGENLTIDLTIVNKGSHCDSLQTYIVSSSQFQIDFISNADSIGFDSLAYYWYVNDFNGNLNHQRFSSTASVILPSSSNLDTILACLYIEDNSIINPLQHCNICDTLVWDGINWVKTAQVITSGSLYHPINLNFGSQSLLNTNQTFVPIYLPVSIYTPFGFTTGDSIDVSISFLNVNQFSFLQAGDNIVIIWPSSIGPIDADTSVTPIFIQNNTSYFGENYFEENKNSVTFDLLGREYFSDSQLIEGVIYIRNGKKFIYKK